MKRTGHLLTLMIVMVSLLVGARPAAAAPLQTPAILSLKDLGASNDILLHGPYDSSRLRFSLPATWTLQEGAALNLAISAFFTTNEKGAAPADSPDNYIGAVLDVYFNGHLEQSVPLRSGNNLLYQVSLDAADLSSQTKDGSLEIAFLLDASVDCNYQFHHTTVMISQTSQAVLPYAETPVRLDLHRFPWPIYQTGLQIPQSAFVVIPTAASPSEVQAGLIAMATLGRMSSSNLPVRLITTDELTEEIRNQSDLVFVGKGAGFPMLQKIALPIGIADHTYSSPELHADDGLLELAASPWNSVKTLLVVGGNNDEGVVKAAQALSTGTIQTGRTNDYSVVAQVNPSAAASGTQGLQTSADVTFADVGYETQTSASVGTNWFSYIITIPTGQVALEDPYIDFVYAQAALVDTARSGVVVYVNGDVAGSIPLTAETLSKATTRIHLPVSSLQPGKNKIDVAATLVPIDECSAFTFSGLWVTIFTDSTLHLPLGPAGTTSFALKDLSTYPFPFANDPTLGTTTFVLPKADHSAWGVAGDVAYDLGSRATGTELDFGAAFDGALTDPVRGQNLIVVGLPSELTILQDLAKVLPARFDTGSNVAVLEAQEVIYRIADGKSVGYLQLLTSPWKSDRGIMAVLGTTEDGVASAGKAISTSKVRTTLKGDLVTVDGEQTLVVDTRSGLGVSRMTSSPGATTTAQPQNAVPLPAPNPTDNKQPIAIGLVAIGLLIAGVVVWTILAQRRKPPRVR